MESDLRVGTRTKIDILFLCMYGKPHRHTSCHVKTLTSAPTHSSIILPAGVPHGLF